jgi:hypothetical protein
VVDEEGNPLRVYHGTTQTFDVFDPDRASIEADWGRGLYFTNEPEDVGANYAGVGPDLENKIEREMERLETTDEMGGDLRALVMSRLAPHGGLTLPVYLKMENPAVLGGKDETVLTYEIEYSEDGEDIVGETGTLLTFVRAVRNIATDYHDGDVDGFVESLVQHAQDWGGVKLSKLRDIMREAETFGYLTDDEGNLANHEIVRRALEETGFDGIIDRTVDIKFGSSRRVGRKMVGVNPDTVHYVVFRPEQVKSALGNRTFNPKSRKYTEAG